MAERFFARAPGKVMLAGEYAVLEGAPALVMAVDRYAHAVASREALHDSDGWHTPELAAALELAREESLIASHVHARVQPGSLFDGARKLGLGSSAAMCVAGVFAAALASGLDLDAADVRAKCTSVALRGHRRAQGGGSGLDVYASAIGGVFCTSIENGQSTSIESLSLPDGLAWRVLWTGNPVSTKEFVATVRALAAKDPALHREKISALREHATQFRQALRDGDARALIAVVRAAGAAMDALGQAAGIPIVTDVMRALTVRADRCGCAIKPSGAGGGDIVFAVGPSASAMDELARECASLGVTPLDLRVDARGAISVAEPR